MRAIMELKMIGKMHPNAKQELDEWMHRNIKEYSVDICMERGALSKEHQNYEIQRGYEKLGMEIAAHMNPYPSWGKNEFKPFDTCTLKVLGFKNEYGK